MAAQFAAPTARSKSSQLSDLIRSLSRRSWFGVEVLGDPREQGRPGEAEHVAGDSAARSSSGGGGVSRSGRSRSTPSSTSRLAASLTSSDHVVGRGPGRQAGRRRVCASDSISASRSAGVELADDGGGLDAAEQGVDRLADQGAAQLGAELRQPARRQVAKRLIDCARDRHRRFVDQPSRSSAEAEVAEQALGLQARRARPASGPRRPRTGAYAWARARGRGG